MTDKTTWLQVRLCMPSPVKLEKFKVGTKFKLSAPMSKSTTQIFNDLVNYFDTPANLTDLHMATGVDECIEKIAANESDFGLTFVSYYDQQETYVVPTPYMVRQMNMIGAYNYSNYIVRSAQTQGDALEEFASFSVWTYVAFIFMLTTIFTVRWMIEKIFHYSIRTENIRRRINNIQSALLVEYCKSWLMFYAISCFMMMYKTSAVVTPRPDLIKSYQSLLARRDAYPVFMNTLFKDSDLFQFAPEGSLQSQVWGRLMSAKNHSDLIITGTDASAEFVMMMSNLIEKLALGKAAVITSGQMGLTMKALICSFARAPHLTKPYMVTQQNEQQHLLGWPINKYFPHIKIISRIARKVFEPGIAEIAFQRAKVDEGFAVLGSERDYKRIQWPLCVDDGPIFPEMTEKLHIIGFDHYLKFFHIICYLFAVISVLFIIEFAYGHICKRRKRYIVRSKFPGQSANRLYVY